MKNSLRFGHLLSVSALVMGAPAFLPHASAQAVAGATAEAQGLAIKAQLKELDAQLDRLDELEDNAPNADEKAAARARIKVLKDRRSELRKDYVGARYDALKADVRQELDKLSAWSRRTFSNSPDAKLDRKVEELRDRERADARATERAISEARDGVNAAASDIGSYRTSPTDVNRADAKASLAILDAEIKRLDERCDDLPRGGERDAAKLRIKALRERRSELASDFRQARYDALMADVKGEWTRITR